MISKEKILKHLENFNIPEIIVLEEIDSTNSEAKRLSKKMDSAVIIANSQTSGRGRLSRTFYSPKDNGIYMSLLLKPEFSTDKSVLITTATSVIVAKKIEEITGKIPQIKWVNDLYLNNKKICGILCESVFDVKNSKIEHIIIGIGINCFNSDFPDDISNIAGAIAKDELQFSREELIAAIIKEFISFNEMINAKAFIQEYKERSMVLGREIEIVSGGFAKAVDIDENGGLVIKMKNGEMKTLNSGEISIRLKEEE